MELTIIAENKPGILFKASLVFKRHGYKIKQKQQEYQGDFRYVLYSFLLSGNGNSDGLVEALIAINYVTNVKIIQQDIVDNDTKTDREALSKYLIQIIEEIINIYPNLVKVVQKVEQNPEINDQHLFEIGQAVGKGLVNQGKIKLVSAKNLSSSIKKLILPTIEHFAIAEARENALLIHANLFCLNKTTDEPSCCCYFLKGMIQGLLHLQSMGNLPELNVNEKSCKAKGEDYCALIIS